MRLSKSKTEWWAHRTYPLDHPVYYNIQHKTKSAPPQGRRIRARHNPGEGLVCNLDRLDLYRTYNCSVDANVGHKLQFAAIDKTGRGLLKIYFFTVYKLLARHYMAASGEGRNTVYKKYSNCTFVFTEWILQYNGNVRVKNSTYFYRDLRVFLDDQNNIYGY